MPKQNQAVGELQREIQPMPPLKPHLDLQIHSQRLGITLHSIGDAVIATDTEGIVTFMNPVAESLTGWAARDGIGRRLPEVFHTIDEASPQPGGGSARANANPLVVTEDKANQKLLIANDGCERAIDECTAPIHDSDGQIVGSVMVFRDVSQQREAEQRRTARLAVTQILADQADIEVAIAETLAAVCSVLNWDVGCFWRLHPDDHLLRCHEFWSEPSKELGEFREATERLVFKRGENLPGRIWKHREPVWISDVVLDPRFIRAPQAKAADLHGGFACPVTAGKKFLGVVEWFSHEIQPPDDDLLEMMATIGGQLGQFIERREAELKLRRSELELADFFENASIGLHWVGPDGKILRANQTELDLLGYSSDEYIGRHIAEFHVDEEVIEEILTRLLNGESLHKQPARLRCKDGSIRDVTINSNALFEDGKFIHSRCFTFDVTDQKRAEVALVESEQRFRSVVESLPAAIYTCDAQGYVTLYNDAAVELWGRRPVAGQDQWCGSWKLYHPDGGPMSLDDCPMAIALREKTAVRDREIVVERPDGIRRHVLPYPVPIVDGSGTLTGAINMLVDITERKQAEESLRRHSEEIQTLLETLPIGVFFAHDAECSRITANRTGYEMLRMSMNENASMSAPAGDQPTHFRMFRGKNEVPPERLPIQRAARGESVRNEEVDVVFYDGTVLHLLISAAPLCDELGQPRGAVASVLDATERKQMEHSLKFLAEASKSLSSLVDFKSTLQQVAHLAVPQFADWCAVDMLDANGVLQRLAVAHVDPAKIELAEELHRRYPSDPASPRGAANVLRTGKAEIACSISDAMLVEAADDDEHLRLLRSLNLGSYICVPLTAKGKTLGVMTFVCAESGRKFGNDELAMAQDLAHRAAIAIENARLYQELREADRHKDEFLAMLAHELRNPLATIRSGLDILATDIDGHGSTIGLMHEQVQRLVRLVDDLLDVSRIMQGKISLRKNPVELSVLIRRSVEAVRSNVDSDSYDFLITMPDREIWVNADPIRLVQVIENLLNNAFKYTDPGGQVELTAMREGGRAIIGVRDTGIGIEPNLLPTVFDLFTQSSRSLDRAQGGVGIGLTLVRQLVEMHNGTVSASSNGPGHGSEFVVSLPVIESAIPRDRAAATHQPAQGVRLLVVDDNVAAARMLSMVLEKSGNHIVQTVHDGLAVIERVKEFRPQVILLDIGLPGMNGYQVAKKIRQTREFDDMLIVALTGYGRQEDRQRSLEAGFDKHLVKPVEVTDLEALLAECFPAGK